MIQQGQVFKLKATGGDGEPLWAYRYRVAGGGSAGLQVGGFSTRAEAQRTLQNKLARLLPGGRKLDRYAPSAAGRRLGRENLDARRMQLPQFFDPERGGGKPLKARR